MNPHVKGPVKESPDLSMPRDIILRTTIQPGNVNQNTVHQQNTIIEVFSCDVITKFGTHPHTCVFNARLVLLPPLFLCALFVRGLLELP